MSEANTDPTSMPRATGDASAGQKTAAGDRPRDLESLLVLIAEDEEPIAETMALVVEDAGYMPLLAAHGRQALELARKWRPALIISDLMMPYLDGAALIAELRADAAAGGHAVAPVILMTAAGHRRAQEAGADAVLRKPFDLEELESLLQRFLGPAGARAGVPPHRASERG
ncbi:MAG: hypothetical protein PVSMB4_15790 [Ktedonobacterales bacterium]